MNKREVGKGFQRDQRDSEEEQRDRENPENRSTIPYHFSFNFITMGSIYKLITTKESLILILILESCSSYLTMSKLPNSFNLLDLLVLLDELIP